MRSPSNRLTRADRVSGLGQMGYGMAANVRKKLPSQSTLFVNDVNRSACEKFKEEYSSHGAIEIIDTAKEVASKSSILISIVPASQHVKQVYLDKENGVIATTPNDNRLILECSTIDVDSTREVGKATMDAGCGHYVDTPVSVSLQHQPTCCYVAADSGREAQKELQQAYYPLCWDAPSPMHTPVKLDKLFH